MYCPYCGSSVDDNAKFCPGCGADLKSNASGQQPSAAASASISGNAQDAGSSSENISQPSPVQNIDAKNQPAKKSRSSIVVSILFLIGGVLLLYDGVTLMGFDWGLLALASGIGLLVTGILGIVKPDKKIIAIISVVDGAVMFVLALMCASGFDWTYIGYLVAVLMLASGILNLVKVSGMIISVIEIIIAAILLVFGIMCSDFVWGDIAIFVSVPFLVQAVINIVTSRKK